jgi:caa(3)-type oxidase subunit IV
LAAYFNLSTFNLMLAVGIALLKTLFIILFFMHVKVSSRLVKLFGAAGLLWLAIMFTLTLSDYLSRIWVPVLNQLQYLGNMGKTAVARSGPIQTSTVIAMGDPLC